MEADQGLGQYEYNYGNGLDSPMSYYNAYGAGDLQNVGGSSSSAGNNDSMVSTPSGASAQQAGQQQQQQRHQQMPSASSAGSYGNGASQQQPQQQYAMYQHHHQPPPQPQQQQQQPHASSSLSGYESFSAYNTAQPAQLHHHQQHQQHQPHQPPSAMSAPSTSKSAYSSPAMAPSNSNTPAPAPAPAAKSSKSSSTKHRSSIDQHHLKDVGGGTLGPTAHVKASSTTSEFTKRRNWSQHIIDEIQDFMHVLTPTAVVMFSAPSVQELTGWTVDDIVGKRIYDFIHPDDLDGFKRDFEKSLQDGSNLTLYYRFRMKDDRYTIFETTGHPYYAEENGITQCKCFFAVGRPYPSKNTAMLDSFLELKMENERLRQELHIMYREIETGAGPIAGDLGAYGVDLGFDPSKGVIDPSTGLVQTSTLMPSSSNTYGALGIGISQAAARGEGSEKKKKKAKADEGEFVCRDCGTVDSPEWRKGPDGPKSLCNACGLRYAKLRSKQEKGQSSSSKKEMRSAS